MLANRDRDHMLPNQTRYQTALCPDVCLRPYFIRVFRTQWQPPRLGQSERKGPKRPRAKQQVPRIYRKFRSDRSERYYRGLCDCGEHAWAVLTQGFVAFVSPQDALFLSEAMWHVLISSDKLVYAIRIKKGRRVRLHRELLSDPSSDVDHRDHNGLNNRRSNLRTCLPVQNSGNSRQRAGASGFRGVHAVKQTGRWCACIAHRHLGTFDTPEEAAKAYDIAAIKRFGEFAMTNFPRAGVER